MSSFQLMRIIISLTVTLAAAILLIKRWKFDARKVYLFSIFSFFLLDIPLSQVIFENELFKFNTSMEASEYFDSAKGDVLFSEGENLALINKGSDGAFLYYKENGNWKIPGRVFAHPDIYRLKIYPDFDIGLRGVPSINEYLITISSVVREGVPRQHEISDRFGTVYSEDASDPRITYYSAFIHADISGYEVVIDGRPYPMKAVVEDSFIAMD